MSDDSMNGNVEEASEALPQSSKLLSGSSLLQVHVSAGKGLPKDGAKDFSPTNSWMEKKQIQCALDERKELLDEERVDKWSCLAGAVWNHKKKLAEVTRRAGKHFQTLGFEKEGTLYLYPEEALYMLETNSLELDFGGVPVSIQQGYSLLLGPSTGCELNEYRTYSHLMRQGYRLLRYMKQIVHTKYERTIRLDQHAPVKRNHPGQVVKGEQKKSGKSSSQANKIEDVMTKDTVNEVSPSSKEETLGTSEETLGTSKETTINAENVTATDSSISEETSKTSKVETDQDKEFEPHQPAEIKEDQVPSLIENTETSEEASKNTTDNSSIEGTIKDSHNKICNESENQEITASMSEIPEKVQESEVQVPSISEKTDNIDRSEKPDIVLQGNVSHDGLRTKAYGIAESLLSMGSALVGKKPSEDHNSSDETNAAETLAAALQSEIMKMLGAELDTGVSEEALATVASNAASTILSHVSSSGNEETTAEINNQENILDSSEDSFNLIMDQSPQESSLPVCPSNSTNEVPVCQNIDSCDSDSVMVCSNDNDGDDSQQLKNQNTDSNDSGSIMVFSSCDNVRTGREGSSGMKRLATSEEDLVPDRPSPLKRAKQEANGDEDVEILDYVPEKKHVELVDLSDDSSRDSKVNEDRNCIEVIDVGDSSSSATTSEFTSSDSNDSSVIVEERTGSDLGFTWEMERREILNMFPNMHNLTEMTVRPPRPELLPPNVRPQRALYRINRHRLEADGRSRSRSTSPEERCPSPYVDRTPSAEPGPLVGPPALMHQRRPLGYVPPWPPQQLQQLQQLQPGLPVNPVEAVQAIARMVLPMLGLPADAFPPEQARLWMPNNAWFPHRPWGTRRPGPWRGASRGVPHRFPRAPGPGRGGGGAFQPFQSYVPLGHPSRPYGPRRFARRRPHRGGGGPGRGGPGRGGPGRGHERWRPVVDDAPSTSRGQANDGRGEQHQQHWRPGSWRQVKVRLLRKSVKTKRYFNPPKNFHHMHSLLDGDQSGDGVSDGASDNPDSPNVKAESDSSDEGSTSMEENDNDNDNENAGDNDNNSSLDITDESCISPTEVKPLLSPRDCTDFQSVFKSVQVIKEADTQSLVSTIHEHRLKPHFDLFSPSKPFKKGNPPVPDFHLCIMRPGDEVPAPGEIRSLIELLADSVPLMFAVVSPDGISFFQFCDVSLPSVTDNN